MSYTSLHTKKGFTLVEILVATTILVIAMASIALSFRGGMTSWTKGTARMERYLNARVALDMMSREISAAFITTSGIYANQFFYGHGNKVTFIAPVRGVVGKSDLCTIKYELNAPANELRRIKEASIDGDITDVTTSTGQAAPLASYVTGLGLEYYDGVRGVWQAAWDSTTKGWLPRAVRITITIRDELQREGPQTFSTIVYLPTSR